MRSQRPRVVLYNPVAPYFTMPLALIALGAAIDRSRFDVRIVDGRLSADPIRRLVDEAEGAVCVGISVLTGVPIRDALRATQAIRRSRPACRIVWGGWHPSLFPADTLQEAGVDAVVIGQGEDTFAELVVRAARGESFNDVPGCVSADRQRLLIAPAPAARPARDINSLPAHDYSLIDVERYFALKKHRQLDYVTSQGCRFRCTFCADPTVYARGWSGLAPGRVGAELEHLWKQYRFDDVGFQDETFFTQAQRVAEIADEIRRRNLVFTWMATMRADQGARLDDRVLAHCRGAGLRRVMIGLESGSQAMLDWMKKDITLDQVFESADKCRRHGIAVLFNLIVGFPGEPVAAIDETLSVAKRLRAYGPDFQIALFHYRPYPGTPITDELRRQGFPLPRTLAEWAEIEDGSRVSPWLDARARTRLDRFSFYQRIGWAQATRWRRPLQALARWRCRADWYSFPLEKALLERLRRAAIA